MNETLPAKLEFSEKQVQLIKGTLAKGCSDLEFELFMTLAKAYTLDPFKGQIWVVKYGTAPARVFTGRDGFLEIAHRSGQFDGMESGWKTLSEEIDLDGASQGIKERVVGWAKVYRKDMKIPFSVEVDLDEYKKDTEIWKKMPRTMIQKVAESQALRKAFSAFGLYAPEEFGEVEKPPMRNVTPEEPGIKGPTGVMTSASSVPNHIIDADAKQAEGKKPKKKIPTEEELFGKKA